MQTVSWTTLRNRFDLTSPRAMIDTLREEGHMVYINQTSNGTSYRMGKFTESNLGFKANRKVLKNNIQDVVAAGIRVYTANKNTHISILLPV